jgi:hypothetical protein
MAGMYYYQHTYSRRAIRLESDNWPSLEEQKKVEDSVGGSESNLIEDGDGVDYVTSETRPSHVLEDPKHGFNHYLTKEEAAKRSSNISKVTYRLAIALIKGGDSFLGHVIIKFTLDHKTSNNQDFDMLFIDYKGRKVKYFKVNGEYVDDRRVYRKQRLFIPAELQKTGMTNTVDILFESEYVKNCAGVHYFKDLADKEEYVYTNLEPASAHAWFPCFD